MSNIEEHLVLKYYEYVFGEILGFLSKKDIDFSIDLAPGAIPVSKTPYMIITP
jgi:hypothetical protein